MPCPARELDRSRDQPGYGLRVAFELHQRVHGRFTVLSWHGDSEQACILHDHTRPRAELPGRACPRPSVTSRADHGPRGDEVHIQLGDAALLGTLFHNPFDCRGEASMVLA